MDYQRISCDQYSVSQWPNWSELSSHILKLLLCHKQAAVVWKGLYCISRNFQEVLFSWIESKCKNKNSQNILPSLINEKFVPPKTWKSKTTSVHAKAVEFGRFVTAGNDDLNMVKTNITANISKASHVLGDIHSFNIHLMTSPKTYFAF